MFVKKLKFPREIVILLPTFISIQEIIATELTMAKRTDFIDRPAPVVGPDMKGCVHPNLQTGLVRLMPPSK